MSQKKKFRLKNLLPRTLFARSLLILTLPIILTLIISIYIFFDRHWTGTASRLAAGLAGEVSFLVDEVQNHADDEVFMGKLQNDALQHFQVSMRFVKDAEIQNSKDHYIGRSQIIRRVMSQELDKRINEPYRIFVDIEEKWTQIQVQLANGILIITSPQRRLFSSSGYVFLLWMVGVSTILMIVAILFMRNQIRPIKRLAIAAEKYGKGREVPFFKPEGAREVRAAAQSFMDMRARIDRQIQQRTAMLAGVSHDLRTPLTRMKLQVEMLPDGQDKEALKSDMDEMKRMIDAYLQFAKGEGNEEMQRTNIVDLIKHQSHQFSRDGFLIDLKYDDTKNYDLFLRPIAIDRCIGNILSNSKKYANQAWVMVSRDDEHVKITVDDDGQGVDKKHYEDVFKPFYREEKSRNSKTGGVGLGLPIAQDIVLAHGGDIKLDKSSQGGLRVTVILPV